jgi:3-oxoadipate enol-lactonase
MKPALLLLSLFLASCASTPSATPVVFIHGNGGSAAQWRAQVDHVRATGRPAIAIDLPQDGDPSLESMAAAIDRAATGLGFRRFVLVGHSYGGAVVARYASLHPERVAGVVYVDAAAVALPLTAAQESQLTAALRADKMAVVRQWFAPMLAPSREEVRAEVLASVERTPTEAFIGALLSLKAYDARTFVDAYNGPRLALAATAIETPMAFQKQFPEIETVRIANAGHWLMLDDPAAVNAALDAFLAKLP